MSDLNETNDGLWAPLGEQRWRELAEGTGASELQIKFAAARFSGASATAAARKAGYAGDSAALRRAGYAAVRSTAVQNLLELAAINSPGDAKISDKEIDAKIAKLIRSADSNVSLKAMEMFAKREAMRKESGASADEEFSMEDDAKALLASVYSGLLGVAAMHLGLITECGPRLKLTAVPLFEQLAPNIKAEFPEIWDRILNKLDSDCRAEAEQYAALPLADLAALAVKPEETPNSNAALPASLHPCLTTAG